MNESRMVYFSLFLLTLVIQFTNGDHFTALIDMNKAIEISTTLADDLDEYVNMEENRLREVKRIIQDIRESNIQPEKDESYLGNPVKALNIVLRIGGDWKGKLDELVYSDNKDVISKIEEKTSDMLDIDDWNGAIDSILRIQSTYRLKALDIAIGKIVKHLTSEKINTRGCYFIGKRAYYLRKYDLAAEWFEAGIYVRKNNLDFNEKSIIHDDEITLENLYDNLSYAYGRQGLYGKAKRALDEVVLENPFNKGAEKNLQFYIDEMNKGIGLEDTVKRVKRDLNRYEQENEDYEALCRDEQLFEMPKDKYLFCNYYIPHPFFKYQPIKQEILYVEPKLVYWYDILTDEEIKGIQELATPRLNRATVKNPVTGVLEFADYRISKSAWLPNKLSELTARINKRIELMTGLSIESAEDLQVVNYGMGGHYAPHFDFGRKRERDAFELKFGNRIATLIYYMSDVEAGGLTAFNRIGAKVKPVKGGAAFWYNLLPSGEGDLRTRHAACPVILGSKWVMNKWFHERGQEFRRKCELDQGPLENDEGF